MPVERRRYYWDTNIFLHYLEGTPEYAVTIAELLERASGEGLIEIITSTLTISETAFAAWERTHGRLDAGVKSAMDSLWADQSVVNLVEVSSIIAEDARDLMRSMLPDKPPPGWKGLRSPDAIHLATAARQKVAEFHTYDKGLDKYSAQFSFTIGPLPSLPHQLPLA